MTTSPASAKPVKSVRPTKGLRHIHALDGVRGTAYLLVLGHHCFATELPPGPWPALDRAFINFWSFGYLGVDLFFVLSGYLITTLLLLDRRGPHYFRNFYVKRAFRILPIFLVVIAIVWSMHMVSTSYALLSLFFIVTFAQLLHVRSYGPFWSLAIEEQFYLFWPLIVRRFNMRRLRQILWLVILIEPVIRYFFVRGGHSISYYTFTRCDGLAWGALLAMESRLHRLLEGGVRAVSWWKNKGIFVFATGCILAVVGVILSFYPAGGRWDTAVMLSACPLLFSGLLGFILTHRKSWISKIFRNPVLRFYGDISYGSYLVHPYVLAGYDRVVAPYSAGAAGPWILRCAVTCIVTTVTCTVSLYFFERPVMSLRRRLLA